MSDDSKLSTGSLLCGKWRLSHVLGAGGMGTVYEATHRNGKRVAIKVLHADFRSNARARARFLREGYIANRVNHPDVPSVLDDGETEAQDAFLVMDLLRGETLESRRKSRNVSVTEALHVASRVLEVLAAAHDKGIVHRDIKPGNVFLTVDGSVKVLDFGIASIRDALLLPEPGTLTQPGASPGTPSFMAPEQARGRFELVDARTDVWAVGALLFNVLTGRSVHQGETSNELLIAAATSPAIPIACLRPDLNPEIAGLIDRALSLHRELRWPDARAMQQAIATVSLAPSEASASIAPTSLTLDEAEVGSTTGDQLGAVVEGARKARPSTPLGFAGLALLFIGGVALSRGSSHPPATSRATVEVVRPVGSTAEGQALAPVKPDSSPTLVRAEPSSVVGAPSPVASSVSVLSVVRPRAPARSMSAPAPRANRLDAPDALRATSPSPEAKAPEWVAPASVASGATLWNADRAWLERQK